MKVSLKHVNRLLFNWFIESALCKKRKRYISFQYFDKPRETALEKLSETNLLFSKVYCWMWISSRIRNIFSFETVLAKAHPTYYLTKVRFFQNWTQNSWKELYLQRKNSIISMFGAFWFRFIFLLENSLCKSTISVCIAILTFLSCKEVNNKSAFKLN